MCWCGRSRCDRLRCIRHGLEKGKGPFVVVDGQPYQRSTPRLYDFEVRTGLDRYDCIRFYKQDVTERLVL